MEQDCRVCVLLPAAGEGQRMGNGTPKQFLPVLNRPIISYTIEAFESIEWIAAVLVVVQEDMQARMHNVLDKYGHMKTHVTAGADTRFRSIRAGLANLPALCGHASVVIVHDGVRPLVDESCVRDTVRAALQCGASGVTRPLVSTVLSVTDDGYLQHALDRSMFTGSEMPQAFKFDLIQEAFQKCTEEVLDRGTECLHVVQKYCGVTAKLFPGRDMLWKVTYGKDVYALEGMLKELFYCDVTVVGTPLTSSLQQRIQSQFSSLSMKVTCHIQQPCASHSVIVIVDTSLTHALLRHYVTVFTSFRSPVVQARYIGIVIFVVLDNRASSPPTRQTLTAESRPDTLRESSTNPQYQCLQEAVCDVTIEEAVTKQQFLRYAAALKDKNVILTRIDVNELSDKVWALSRDLIFSRGPSFSGQSMEL